MPTARLLGVATPTITAAIESFPGLAHRQQRIAERRRRALRQRQQGDQRRSGFEGARLLPQHLLDHRRPARKKAGSPRRVLLSNRVRRAFLIGEAADQFADELGDAVPHEHCGTLAVAVSSAAAAAQSDGGGVVLLSPACASFDQFRNFEERGEAFRAAVEEELGMVAEASA